MEFLRVPGYSVDYIAVFEPPPSPITDPGTDPESNLVTAPFSRHGEYLIAKQRNILHLVRGGLAASGIRSCADEGDDIVAVDSSPVSKAIIVNRDVYDESETTEGECTGSGETHSLRSSITGGDSSGSNSVRNSPEKGEVELTSSVQSASEHILQRP